MTRNARNADLAAIHIAKAALGWSDDEYRDVLWQVCKVRSSADLDHAGRKRWLAHLGRLTGRTAVSTAAPGDRQQALIEKLWRSLGERGALRDPSPGGLAKFIRRLHGVDSARWLTAVQGSTVVEALKAMQARHDAER